jgi:hypothetical protein
MNENHEQNGMNEGSREKEPDVMVQISNVSQSSCVEGVISS